MIAVIKIRGGIAIVHIVLTLLQIGIAHEGVGIQRGFLEGVNRLQQAHPHIGHAQSHQGVARGLVVELANRITLVIHR